MVSALDSGSSGLGSSAIRGHCVVFLGKTPTRHSIIILPLSIQGPVVRKPINANPGLTNNRGFNFSSINVVSKTISSY